MRTSVLATIAVVALGCRGATGQQLEVAHSVVQLQVLVKPGDTVAVTDVMGREVTGTIASLSSTALELVVSGSRRYFQEGDLQRIRQRRGDSLANGAVWGLGIGAGWGALIVVGLASEDHDTGGPGAVAGFIGALGGLGAAVGVGIDALIRGRPVIYEKPPPGAAVVWLSPLLGRGQKGVRLSLRF
jgi:hypothetical protein